MFQATGLVKKEDDEVLFALANELRNLFPIFSGNKTTLFPLLESLASYEETVVREEAVRTISGIALALSDKEVADIIYPLVPLLRLLPH